MTLLDLEAELRALPGLTIHQRLRRLRMLRGWSRKEAAYSCGVSVECLGKFENGRMPSVPNLMRLCRGLNVSADILLGLRPNVHDAAAPALSPAEKNPAVAAGPDRPAVKPAS